MFIDQCEERGKRSVPSTDRKLRSKMREEERRKRSVPTADRKLLSKMREEERRSSDRVGMLEVCNG